MQICTADTSVPSLLIAEKVLGGVGRQGQRQALKGVQNICICRNRQQLPNYTEPLRASTSQQDIPSVYSKMCQTKQRAPDLLQKRP